MKNIHTFCRNLLNDNRKLRKRNFMLTFSFKNKDATYEQFPFKYN